MKRKWRWPAAGIVGLIVAVSLFVIPALGEVTVAGEVGTVRLHMANDSLGDVVQYDPVAGGDDFPDQPLALSGGCRLDNTDHSLLSIVGSGQEPRRPYAGLKDHRIGVGQNGEGNGEPCARINGDLGQTLTISLGTSLDASAIGYAEIDLGFKFNGSATLSLKNGGAPVGDPLLVDCTSASDCGPDSGGSDNKRVVIFVDDANDPPPPFPEENEFQAAGVFDTIVITPGPASVVSLEAGFNGAPPGPSGSPDTIFTLVESFEGEIDCGETESLDEGDDATVDITRGFDTGGDCKGPPDGLLYNFDSGVEGDELFVEFITDYEPVEGDTLAQFLEVITWNFGAPPNVLDPDFDEQHKTLFYLDPGMADRLVMPWCEGDPRVDGVFPGAQGNEVDPDVYLPGDPGDHTSCLIESKSYVTSDGEFIKVDIVYNVGDGKRWS